MAVRQIYGKQKGNCSRNGGKKGRNKRVEILAPHKNKNKQKTNIKTNKKEIVQETAAKREQTNEWKS